MIGLTHYLVVAAILFTMGVLGIFLNRKNLIVILMAIELILLAVNLNLVAFSRYLQATGSVNAVAGQVFAVFIIVVAAAEAAIGLGIVIALLQALTQIHETTLTFVPKIVVVLLVLLVTGTFVGSQLTSFAEMTYGRIATGF